MKLSQYGMDLHDAIERVTDMMAPRYGSGPKDGSDLHLDDIDELLDAAGNLWRVYYGIDEDLFETEEDSE